MAMNLASGGGGRRRRGRGRAAPLSDMNVTPLVDVMLVLLIIFMVTAPMLTAVQRDGQGKLPAVTLRADHRLDYGKVVGVMGDLNAAGFKSISLVTNGSVEAP